MSTHSRHQGASSRGLMLTFVGIRGQIGTFIWILTIQITAWQVVCSFLQHQVDDETTWSRARVRSSRHGSI